MLLAKLLAIEEHKPTELWNLVKKIKNWSRSQNRVENNIEPKEWLTHFQELLNEGEVAPDSFKLESGSNLNPCFLNLITEFRLVNLTKP